jgi:hypothetical protein
MRATIAGLAASGPIPKFVSPRGTF